MKAAILKKLKNWQYADIQTPKINKNNALIKMQLSGICSTDILRSHKTGFYSYPIIPGHEMIGKIEKIQNNSKYKIGDRVAVYPLIPCERCIYCKKNSPNLCIDYNFLGSRTHGGYSEFVLAPIKNLIKIPKNVSNEKAVFTEPLSVALHAFKISEEQFKPKRILILGLGPIGLLIGLWAKYKKIKNVSSIDRNLNRFKIFKKIGYIDCYNSANKSFNKKITNIKKFDTVFECSGSTYLQKLGIHLTEKKGQFIILSNPNNNLNLDKDTFSKILRNEIKVKGSWSSLIKPNNEWLKTLKILSQKNMDPSILISKSISLKEVPKKMKQMYNKEFPYIKVVVNLNLN